MSFSNAQFGRLLLAGLALGLGACAPTPVRFEPIVDVKWQQQQIIQQQIQSWAISGRISVQTKNDGGQADYTWQQHNLHEYNIRLQAPMGAGTMVINGRENGVTLKTSSGEETFDTDVDKLIQRLNGWPLPVSGLQYWVRALPAPTSAYEVIEWKDSGLPGVMLQDGWRIEFKKYKAFDNKYLPSKVFINRQNGWTNSVEEVDVRLIIRHWAFGNKWGLNPGLNKAQAQ